MQLSSLVRLLKKHSTQIGFTMIELLVVIAILGILAATVLAAINPIEQINRAQDTRIRSDLAQMLTGIDRTFAAQQLYPWNITTPTYTPVATSDTPQEIFTPAAADVDFSWASAMETTGEIKSGLIQRMTAYNTNPANAATKARFRKAVDVAGVASTVRACFFPKSLTFKTEAAAHCNDGTTPGGAAGSPAAPTGFDPCTGAGPWTAASANLELCLP